MTAKEDLLRLYRTEVNHLRKHIDKQDEYIDKQDKEIKILKEHIEDWKIKYRLCDAKNQVLYERNSEEYFNSKK